MGGVLFLEGINERSDCRDRWEILCFLVGDFVGISGYFYFLVRDTEAHTLPILFTTGWEISSMIIHELHISKDDANSEVFLTQPKEDEYCQVICLSVEQIPLVIEMLKKVAGNGMA